MRCSPKFLPLLAVLAFSSLPASADEALLQALVDAGIPISAEVQAAEGSAIADIIGTVIASLDGDVALIQRAIATAVTLAPGQAAAITSAAIAEAPSAAAVIAGAAVSAAPGQASAITSAAVTAAPTLSAAIVAAATAAAPDQAQAIASAAASSLPSNQQEPSDPPSPS